MALDETPSSGNFPLDRTDISIQELVLLNHKTALVLHQYGIAFHEHLQDTLLSVCQHYELDSDRLLRKINALATKPIITLEDLRQVSPMLVVEYLQHTHHAYTKLMLPLILEHATRFEQSLGERYPLLKPLAQSLHRFAEALEAHIAMEEEQLFPYILGLEYATRELSAEQFWLVRDQSLDAIEAQVTDTDDLAEAARLTQQFAFSLQDHTFYQVLMQELADFRQELHLHHSIEDEVLMPAAREREQALFQRIKALSRLN